MRKSTIIALSAALVALVAVMGVAISTYAQTTSDNSGTTAPGPFHMGIWDQLSDSAKTEIQNLVTNQKAEREANGQKITDAMNQGYDAWVAAVKDVMGDSAPILTKVNASNFDQYKQAQGYMQAARDNMRKANDIYQNIGIGGGHFRSGRGMGMRGFNKGFMGMFNPSVGTQTPQTQTQ